MKHNQFLSALKLLQLHIIVLVFLAGCQKSINEKQVVPNSVSNDMATAFSLSNESATTAQD